MNHIGTVLAGIAIVAAIFVVTLPLIAVVLVSVASKREESAHSLSHQPPGSAEAMARRLLGFHADPTAAEEARRAAQVRFAYAHRTLPGASVQRAVREPGAGARGPYERTGAAV